MLLVVGLAALLWGGWQLLTLLLRALDHDGLSGHKTLWTAVKGILGVGFAVLVLPRAAQWMRS